MEAVGSSPVASHDFNNILTVITGTIEILQAVADKRIWWRWRR